MELMDHCLASGGNVVDTSASYACCLPGGEQQSEKVIGEWLRERGTRVQSDQIILSTKRPDPRLESMEVPRLSKTEIQADLDSSFPNTLEKIFADACIRMLFDHQGNRDRFRRLRCLQRRYGFSVGQIVIGDLINQPIPVFALTDPKIPAKQKDSISPARTKLLGEDNLEGGARI